MADTQISAFISSDTREQIERYADSHGLKKGALIERALLHHLQALRELPADIIIPPRLVLTKEGGKDLIRHIKKPNRPTKAMRDLMTGKLKDDVPA